MSGGPPDDTGRATWGEEDPDTCDTLEVALTPDCVVGDEIGDVETADALCADALGEGWRWLDFHASLGWYVQAQIDPDAWATNLRAWVWINDQDAECFSSPQREIIEGQPEYFGMTWQPLELDNENCSAATCNHPAGFDEPGYDPREGPACNPYEGDTPCSACRPLLCVRDL